jgi:hypothetical protein
VRLARNDDDKEHVSLPDADAVDERVGIAGQCEHCVDVLSSSSQRCMLAVKYFDLSHERTRAYQFQFARMLALRGNTAFYLLYATARLAALLRRAPPRTCDSVLCARVTCVTSR